MRRLIHKAKYQHCLRSLKTLQSLFLRGVERKGYLFIGDVIFVPVPTSRTRLRQRGFCLPCELLFQGKFKKHKAKILQKIKDTEKNAFLSAEERRTNLLSSFKHLTNMGNYDTDSTVFLVDDVYTSGATLEICAKTLKDAGYNTIHGITLCRTIP